MRPPRPLFVSHTGAVSGAERVLLDVVKVWPGASAFVFEQGQLAESLRAQGLNVTVAKSGGSLSTVRRSSSALSVLPVLAKLAGIGRQLASFAKDFDVIYANSQKAFTLSALASFVARKPLIWHLHDILSDAHFGKKQKKMQVFLANHCAKRVIVPSNATKQAFIDAGGKPNLVQVIANGVSGAPDPRSKAQHRQDLGLPNGPLIGVFSRLAPWKGQETVIRALVQLTDVTGIFAGDALFGEAPYAEKLKALAKDLGVQNRVIFLGQRHDVPQLMQAMDVMVHPSIDAEPFGLTLVEAMLAGVPIVATDAGASAEILENGRAGTLIPPSNALALAAAIANILANPDSFAEQIDYASRRATSHYSVAQMQTAIATLIAQVGGKA